MRGKPYGRNMATRYPFGNDGRPGVGNGGAGLGCLKRIVRNEQSAACLASRNTTHAYMTGRRTRRTGLHRCCTDDTRDRVRGGGLLNPRRGIGWNPKNGCSATRKRSAPRLRTITEGKQIVSALEPVAAFGMPTANPPHSQVTCCPRAPA